MDSIYSIEEQIRVLNNERSALSDSNQELRQYNSLEVAFNALKEKNLGIAFEIRTNEDLLSKLKNEINSANSLIELNECGMEKRIYNFGNAEKYEIEIEALRTLQATMIREKQAIICKREWTVGGSKAEGTKMINRLIKLGLNAFNYQSDNIILNVKYSNYQKSKEKIEKLRDSIEKLLEVNECYVSKEYYKLKIKELDLVFEYQEKLQEEKEEQRAIKLKMQEEEKVRKEIEKVKNEAEKEEIQFTKALDKARKELENKQGLELNELQLKIQEMEKLLAEAHEKKERAISQAELTKRGHVYIISNIGAFGENVFKIGMTRRLDPMDRVWELGDASVPFDFDVHAMIFSEDAPQLEKDLHAHFTKCRLNQVNMRKEFFNVNLEAIESICLTKKLDIKITKYAEAKEFRQSAAKLEDFKKVA